MTNNDLAKKLLIFEHFLYPLYIHYFNPSTKVPSEEGGIPILQMR